MSTFVEEIPNSGAPYSFIDELVFPMPDERLGITDFSECNPFFEDIEEEIIEFARKYNILLEPAYLDYYDMAAYIYHDAGREELLLLSKIMMILFYIDDTQGEHHGNQDGISPEQLLAGVLGLFNNLGAKTNINVKNPIIAALAEVLNELSETSSADFMRRFITNSIEYLRMNVDLSSRFGMSLTEYEDYRIKNSGMIITIDLVEQAMRKYLPQEFFEKESGYIYSLIDGVRRSVAIIGAYSNDLTSFPKEYYGQDTGLNLVVIIMKLNEMNVLDAYKHAFSIVNMNLDLFSQYTDELLTISEPFPEFNQIIKSYLSGLWRLVIASKNWQLHTNRYKHIKHLIKELLLKLND